MSENGTILKNLVKQFIEKKYPKCLDWFDNNIEFPLSMVDGIVPNNNKQSEYFNLPYNDNTIVVTEPYRDWYIQSNNVVLKKILNNKNIIFVDNIKFYENIKLKIGRSDISEIDRAIYSAEKLDNETFYGGAVADTELIEIEDIENHQNICLLYTSDAADD